MARTSHNDTPNFESILDEAPTEVERPKPWPVGQYVVIVVGQVRHGKSSKKQTPFVEPTFKPIEALDSVDEEALEEFGGLGSKTIRAQYYLTEDAKWRLDELFENCGIELGRSRSVMLAELPGKQLIITIGHEPGEGDQIYAKVTGTAAVE